MTEPIWQPSRQRIEAANPPAFIRSIQGEPPPPTPAHAPPLAATRTSVGRPITFTTLTLTLGFAVFAASDVAALVRFGTLSAFAFWWALLADFFFAPALLILLEPLGPEQKAG